MGIGRAYLHIKNFWLAERPQWALWLPVCLGSGIAVYFWLPFEPPALSGTLLSLTGALIYIGTRDDRIRILTAAVSIFAMGFAAAQWRTSLAEAPVISKDTPPIRLKGTIERINLSDNGGRIVLSDLNIAYFSDEKVPAKIRLSLRGKVEHLHDLLPGDSVALTAVLRPPPPPTMPGAFDFQRRAYFLRIGAYGFILGDIRKISPKIPQPRAMSQGFKRGIETLRLRITKRVHEQAPEDAGAVAAALLTGHRSYISAEVLQVMRDAGIAHLLAISGLHIGLVAGIIFSGFRIFCAAISFFALRLNTKKTAAFLAIPAAFAYAVLAGFTVPTERAFLMTGLMLAGVLIDRRALSLRNVCWAATVILLFRPESLTGPGFQMSFAAVTALIAAYSAFSRYRRQSTSDNTSAAGPVMRTVSLAWRYLFGVIITTVVASMATTPFAIFHFQHAAAFGLLANAIAVPLAALWVMPAGIITLWTMPFGLEALPLWIMTMGIDLILSSAAMLAALPGAAVDIPAPPMWSLCFITLSGLWLSLWTLRWRLYALPVLLIGLSGPFFSSSPDLLIDGDARLIAVVHQQSVLLTSTNRSARFEKENWQRRIGLNEESHAWQTSADNAQGRLRCDRSGCMLNLGPDKIAISLNESTLEDDCLLSTMLITTIPVRGPFRKTCKPPWGVIDRFDLWRYGTHAITFTARGPEIHTVNGTRGKRPWVITPGE
ncbi:MAG: ComEC/Rec2 family competence protein [Rhodospirillales bacterium]